MKEEIKNYLMGPRDYREGVGLYQKYGFNLMLKKKFALDETATTKAIMIEELRKLSGMSDQEFRRLPRYAETPGKKMVVEKKQPEVREKKGSGLSEATETQKKMIRFRERYPFLNDADCPDILKVFVADMFTAYGKYNAALEKLYTLRDDESKEAAGLCETVVEEYLKNRELWEELDYYKEHGEILGKASKFKEIEKADELAKLSDLELLKKHNSALVNVSKRRKALDAATAREDSKAIDKEKVALASWLEKKEAIEKELEKRKKK